MKNSSEEQNTKAPDRASRILREIKSIIIIVLIALVVRSTVIEAYQVPTGSMENTILVGDFILGNKFIYGLRTPNWFGIPFTHIGFHIPSWRTPPLKEPNQGDVIIFQYPLDDRVNYIKRMVAEPGQTVTIKNKVLYVDGEQFSNPPHAKFTSSHLRPAHWQEPNIFPPGMGNKDNYGPFHVPAQGDTLWFAKDGPAFIRYIANQDGHSFFNQAGDYYIDGRISPYYVVNQDYYFAMGDNRDNSWDSRYWGPVPFNNMLGEGMITYFSWNKNIPLYRIFDKVRWGRIGHLVR